MAKSKIYPFNFSAGTKRDNTLFDGNYYSDAKWCRWYRGKAKKIGGYQSVYDQMPEIIHGEPIVFSKNNYNYVYGGSENYLSMLVLQSSGGAGAFYDRTPVGFTADATNEWKTTAIWNSAGTEMAVVAMATQTLFDVSDDTDRKIYYGDIHDTTALAQLGTIEVSGGIVALPPYLFAYGNEGYLAWSDKNAIASIGAGGGGDAGEARICANKVVKGIPLRGGSNNSPSGLFFSLDTVQRISFVGGTSIFRNDTVATGVSILSTNAVVDYDGIIVWAAGDRFLSYNGVVQEIKNDTHLDWFFDNYNKTCPQKIFAIKQPRFGEIWFCFPFGNATECTHALIYNIREGYWYDTELPEGGRSAGLSPTSMFQNPIMFGVQETSINRYHVWEHEFGVDKIVDGSALAIESYFETPNICYIDEGPLGEGSWSGSNTWVRLIRLEPDFVLSGHLDVTVKGRTFAMSNDLPEEEYTYDASVSQKIDSRKQFRQMRIRFRSNEQGGNYYQGKCLMELSEGDVRAASGSR